MNQNPEAFNADIEHRLTRLACDIVVDGSAPAVAAAVGELIAAVEAGGGSQLAAQIREVAGSTSDPHVLPAALTTLWRDWFAEDEVRRDVEALAGDPELCSMFIG